MRESAGVYQDLSGGINEVAKSREPSMDVILHRFRSSVNLYSNITMETMDKLNTLKAFDPLSEEPPSLKMSCNCVLDEITEVLNHLDKVNEMAARNLYHLKGIV